MMRPVALIGVPADLGASRRGTDMGPSALRYTRLQALLQELGRSVQDHGNVPVPVPECIRFGGGICDQEQGHFLEAVRALSEETAAAVARACRGGAVPLILGGDHSMTIGTVAGLADAYERFGIIWVDAHADFNTPETSPSGNIHGMSLAVAAGLGHPALTDLGGRRGKVLPQHIVVLGARSIDHPGEAQLLSESGVRVITMTEIDQTGMAEAVREAVDRAAAGGAQGVLVSFDMDVIDPVHAPGVGTPVVGGLTYREAHLAMELLYESGAVLALELAELNPILDEGNRTARLAVELCLSAFGKRIYRPASPVLYGPR